MVKGKSSAVPQRGEALAAQASRRRQGYNKRLVAYSFIAPNFIGFAVFTLVPMILAIVLAF